MRVGGGEPKVSDTALTQAVEVPEAVPPHEPPSFPLTPELSALIREQATDARFGDRVFSISLDAVEESTATDDAGEKVLRPRSPHRTKRVRGLLGHGARVRARRKRYAGVCGRCGGATDGSNGRAKAPKRCAACVKAVAAAVYEAEPHGTVKKYRGGCRCQPCRWENARVCWDYAQRRRSGVEK